MLRESLVSTIYPMHDVPDVGETPRCLWRLFHETVIS